MCALGRFVRFRNGADYSRVEVDEGGYPVYGSGGEFGRASEYLFDGESVLFGRKGTVDKPLHVDGRFWTVDTMFFTEIGAALVPRYVFYWATQLPYSYWVTSTALPSMTKSDLATAKIPLINGEDQRSIVKFLDRETAEIDAFISDQEELIKLLAERRAATISHAVTKGLDASVQMKATDCTWLDEIPIHWAVARISRCFNITLGKMVDGARESQPGEVSIPYLRAANIRRGSLSLESVYEMPFLPREVSILDLRRGDLLVVEGGATVGMNAVLETEMPGWSFQKTVNRVRAKADASTRFLSFYIDHLREREVIEMVAAASTFQHLTAEKLERLEMPLPPIAEQNRIVEFLLRETSEIDAAMADAREAIALSRERRAALISAAVTGKIDVRDAA